MSETPQNSEANLTSMLADFSSGDRNLQNAVYEKIYENLKAIAARQMFSERGDHTLQPTALVNEAYLKLIGQKNDDWQNRKHFFAMAAKIMRRLLVDHARAKSAAKRGDGKAAATYIEDQMPGAAPENSGVDVLALEEALTELSKEFPRPAQVVELKYFAGLDINETASALEISPASVKRDWSFARAWLKSHLDSQ